MKKILVIEDDQIMRDNIAELLELDGYKVSVAKNGKDGVELAQDLLPDLIVCDIKMPVLDGFGVLHILHKDSQTANIPFIFLTAKTEKEDFRKGMEMGADDFLAKPFEDTELLNAVETRLKKNEFSNQNPKQSSQIESLTDIVQVIDRLKETSKNSRVETYSSKEYIYKEGAYPHYIFFLEQGQVKSYRLNKDGKEFITGMIQENELFGYQAIIENRSYQETAQTTEDSEILKIPKDQFISLILENTKVAKEFIKIISKDLTKTEVELSQMAYDSVRKRVGIKLIELMQADNENTVTVYISRTDLASMVGTTTETIVRTLSELKDLDLIDADHHKIILLNKKKLQEFLKQW